MKFGKVMICVVMLILCGSMTGLKVDATPPGYIKMTYEGGVLNVLILHFSLAPRLHYIYRVEIEKNGVIYLTENYQNQPKFWFIMYQYNVTANPGDEITVNAYCSLFGQKSGSITVSYNTYELQVFSAV